MSGLEVKTEKQVKEILIRAGDAIEKILGDECVILVDTPQ